MLQSYSEDERQTYGTKNHHDFGKKLNKSGTDIFDKLKLMYGEDTMSRSSVFEWAKRFAEGLKTRSWDAHRLPKRTKMSKG